MNSLRLQLHFMHSNLHNPTLNSPRIIHTKSKFNPITSLPPLVNRRTERKSNHDDRTLINLASLKSKIHPRNELSAVTSKGHSRIVFLGATSLALAVLLMGFDDHQKAFALGPEGPLMEEFWDNMRRYGLYVLTVSSGAIYTLLQPLVELLKNPISAVLILVIFGGGIFIVSQVVTAMKNMSDVVTQKEMRQWALRILLLCLCANGSYSTRIGESGMAKNDVCDPLLAPDADSSYQSSSSAALKKRKSGRCKSVPVEDINHPEQHLESSFHQPYSNFADYPDLKRVTIFLAAYLGIGSLCFFLVSHQIKGNKTNGIIDAVYFCIVTMTTVGYGDLVPDSVVSKLLACVFVFIGMALVGFLLSKAADYIVEKQEIIMVQAIHMHEKCSPVEILREVETHRAKYKVITALAFLLLLVCSGVLFLSLKEGLDLFDAFYCVCATITTLGYGDKSFSTSGGRLFASFWILISTICLAQFFYSVAELYTEKRRRSLVNWVLSRKLTVTDLEAADLDNDKVVSAAEFVVFKLKEMGKISEEDIAVVMAGFRSLDIDHSGTLTKADLLNPE